MQLSTWAAGSGFVGWVQWFLHWINHRPNPWVLSLRWYVNVFLQTSIWETITVRIGLLSGNEKERKNMKLPSEPILFCPTSLTRTSCWNDDFPRGLHHSLSLLLEHYIFLKVSHVTLSEYNSESRVLLKEKRAGGRKETQSLAGVTIWDDEGWWPDMKSRLQSVKNSTGTDTFPVSSPPHPSKPFTYSSSRRWQIVNGSYCCGREQAASPIGYRAAVFLGLINVSDSSSQLSLSCRVFYRAPERQAVM